MENNKFKRNRRFVRIILIISLLFLLAMAFIIIPNAQLKTNLANTSLPTEDQEKEPKEQDIIVNQEIFKDNTCDFVGTGNLKFIDIATPENRIYTPENTYHTEQTAKTITVSGNIIEAYLCIISDISDKKSSYKDYRKHMSYRAVTKIIFGDNRGAANAGYYLPKKQFYDYDSDSTKRIPKETNGAYWSHETPFRQILNLNSVILADETNGGYNYHPLINELKDGNTLQIGGYMTKLGKDAYWASSISYYRLIWKGDGSINFVK